MAGELSLERSEYIQEAVDALTVVGGKMNERQLDDAEQTCFEIWEVYFAFEAAFHNTRTGRILSDLAETVPTYLGLSDDQIHLSRQRVIAKMALSGDPKSKGKGSGALLNPF